MRVVPVDVVVSVAAWKPLAQAAPVAVSFHSAAIRKNETLPAFPKLRPEVARGWDSTTYGLPLFFLGIQSNSQNALTPHERIVKANYESIRVRVGAQDVEPRSPCL